MLNKIQNLIEDRISNVIEHRRYVHFH